MNGSSAAATSATTRWKRSSNMKKKKPGRRRPSSRRPEQPTITPTSYTTSRDLTSGIGMRCPPAVLALSHPAPERNAPDDAVEEGPAQGLSVQDAVLQVGGRLLGVGRPVDPASAAFFGGIMVGRPSPPGW